MIPHRAIRFALTRPDDQKEARTELASAISEAIKPDFEADNPITHARGKLEFEERASPAMKVLAEEVAALRGRIDSMEAATARSNALRWKSPKSADYYVPRSSVFDDEVSVRLRDPIGLWRDPSRPRIRSGCDQKKRIMCPPQRDRLLPTRCA